MASRKPQTSDLYLGDTGGDDARDFCRPGKDHRGPASVGRLSEGACRGRAACRDVAIANSGRSKGGAVYHRERQFGEWRDRK